MRAPWGGSVGRSCCSWPQSEVLAVPAEAWDPLVTVGTWHSSSEEGQKSLDLGLDSNRLNVHLGSQS